MRVTTLSVSPALRRICRVTIDGQMIRGVLEADSDQGYVIVTEKDDRGGIVVSREGLVRERKVFGRVEIAFAKGIPQCLE